MTQLAAWLRLIRSENVGPITFWNLLRRFETIERATEGAVELSAMGGRKISLLPIAKAFEEIEQHHKAGFQLIAGFDSHFPNRLKQLIDCPPILSIKGLLRTLLKPGIAIVGSRNAAHHSLQLAYTLAEQLGHQGWQVISGLARGIDSYAHKGSLRTGTVAVIAGGIDIVYPPENRALYDQIAENGIIVSEMPFGLYPGASHFPRRNRIISGLSHGVVIVEAAFRSGSLITARCALEQGRDLFAVPGSPVDPRAKGCNQLIRDGAHMVETAEDILRIITEDSARTELYEEPKILKQDISFEAPSENEIGSLQEHLLQALSIYPTSIDHLVTRLGGSLAVVQLALLQLELAGKIIRHTNNTVALVSEANVA